jgi:hypothetical protein
MSNDREEPRKMIDIAGLIIDRSRLVMMGSAVIVLIVCLIGGILAGGYALSLMAIRQNNATEAQLQLREEQSAVRTSIPTCEALIGLDDAKDGAVFPVYPGARAGQGYGERLAKAINEVVVASKCETLIYDVDHHYSITRIAKDLHEQG